MKNKLIFLLILLIGYLLSAQQKPEAKKDAFDMLSEEKKNQLIEMFLKDYPYIQSKEFKNYPETVNQFFTMPIYSKLTGNYIRGYSYDEGFQFTGNEIHLSDLKAVSNCGSYLKLFVKWLNEVFNKQGIKFVDKDKKCKYEMGICIVSVSPKLTETTFPGLFLEVYFCNKQTGKSCFYRFGQGSKKGLEKAMLDSCTMILATLFTLSPEKIASIK